MEWWSKFKSIMGIPEDEFAAEDEMRAGTQESEPTSSYGDSYRSSYGGYSQRESSKSVKREQSRRESYSDSRRDSRKNNHDERYVNMTAQLQVILAKPEDFSEAPQIADHLINRKTVLLNVEGVDRDTVRRLVDFLSGVAYGQGGALKRVANATFIITPYDVNIMGDVLDELKMERSFF